ncbi:hypothetical protein [Frigidibacter sp. MR17.24]|uniref:hypothetical protein n=1 Tax=Frigidibacter sp. MR17.24 TaxID=3127345 RepID=UPI003012AB7F
MTGARGGTEDGTGGDPPHGAGEDDPLAPLREAAARRLTRHKSAENLLPAPDIDFAPLKAARVDATGLSAEGDRRDFRVQRRKLQVQFAGRPEILVLHALAISYLRRRTPHTETAQILFHRLWAEEGAFLRAQLNARWKISALQTFHDHAETEGQALVGAVGFTFMNLIKVYEAERSLVRRTVPAGGDGSLRTPGFPGLGGFCPGDDILRNITALVLSVAGTDPVAGPILEDLLAEVARRDTVFARLDALADSPPYDRRAEFYGSFGTMLGPNARAGDDRAHKRASAHDGGAPGGDGGGLPE